MKEREVDGVKERLRRRKRERGRARGEGRRRRKNGDMTNKEIEKRKRRSDDMNNTKREGEGVTRVIEVTMQGIIKI